MKKLNRGFTLIELLVVIAIIGILSSIVLASLSSARTKGEDAAIKATLSNMRAQAELYYSNNSNYGNVTTAFESACPTTATASTTAALFGATGGLLSLGSDLASKAGTGNHTCAAEVSGTAWAAAAVLKSDTTKVYCVDSVGTAKESTATLAASIVASACQ